jgi:hypothetical protein
MTTTTTTHEGVSAESSSQPEAPVVGPPEPRAQIKTHDVDVMSASPVVERPQADGAAEPTAFEGATLPQVLKIVGSVVAPTSLLTALMYYFGRLEFAGFFWYLGADVTVLDLTLYDYLDNSADGLTVPLLFVAGTGLLGLWIHQLLLRALPDRTRGKLWRVLMPAAAIVGSILMTLAVVDLVVGGVFPLSFEEGRGLSLVIGVLLLAYALRLLRLLISERRPDQVPRRPPAVVAVAECGAVFLVVSVGLFWAVGSYAIAVGEGHARRLEATLSAKSDVVAYSEKRLILQAPGVQEVVCQDPDAAYRFRYDGLKLVKQSGNQYLFLPAGWTRANGAAILIPRSDKVRLEFSPPNQVRNVTC